MPQDGPAALVSKDFFMPYYVFSAELHTQISVKADSASEAKSLLASVLQCASANFGAFPNGDPILGEISLLNENDESLTLVDD